MNKDKAIHFLELVIAGKINDAYEKYVDFNGKHHNMFTPSGFDNLQKGMQAAEDRSPGKQFEIKNTFGDGNLVAVHSHLAMGSNNPGMATVHMFRFQGDKIIEMWDIAQDIPDNSPNSDGPF